MAWNGQKSRLETAEAKLDAAIMSVGIGAGMTTGQSEELATTIKDWVRALIDEEKSDLRDEINQSGMWDPYY